MAKILIVDDEQDFVQLLKTRLELNHYEVVTAFDGREGLKKAKQDKPDLIILDILMPNVDGIAMAAEVRKDPEIKHIPIVYLTCLVDKKEIKQQGIIGGEIFLAKPLDAKVLLQTLEKLLKK